MYKSLLAGRNRSHLDSDIVALFLNQAPLRRSVGIDSYPYAEPMHPRVRLMILHTQIFETPTQRPSQQCSKRHAITLRDSVQFHEFIQSYSMNSTNNVRRSGHIIIWVTFSGKLNAV